MSAWLGDRWVIALMCWMAAATGPFFASRLEGMEGEDRRVCLVVAPETFRAALGPWIRHREREGIIVRVIDSAATASEVQAMLRAQNEAAIALGRRVGWVLLVGDCSLRGSGRARPSDEVPTHYRPSGPSAKYGTTPTIAGDAPYADLDEDGRPEVAVGRFPVDTPAELEQLVARILEYEQSLDFGRWRDTVQITAGVGGFGILADTAIESATRSVLVSSLPPAVRLAVTYASPASPFHPGANEFFPAVLRRYQEGSLFWVYMGHGQITELDEVRGPDGAGRPVLATRDVDLLDRPPHAAPIAILLACYSGAFDATTDCLAERMLLAKGGPIAVLAGSRLTMPYGNAVAAQGLLHAVYKHRVQRLGEAWLGAQRELAADAADDPELAGRRELIDALARLLSPDPEQLGAERIEHLHLYNLLGDPTLRLKHPQTVSLQVPRRGIPGKDLHIRGEAPHGGCVTLFLCYPPGNVPVPPHLTAREKYEQANCVEVSQEQIESFEGGVFEASVSVPPNVRGVLRIVARVEGPAGWSTGSAAVLVRQ